MKNAIFAATVVLVLLLEGCSAKLNGTYTMATNIGKSSLIFDGSNKVIMDFAGTKLEVQYKIDGKNIKIDNGPGMGVMILTMIDDKTIDGPMGMKYVKIKK